ncbi:MAG: aminotransferase class III-fold pyridoxal phosphate-dependent enzyme [Christensenellaceae bacterium]|jgi:glutamate-1-semialdehyde 2,1-aminomutase|nr:aminotransferase class III-fold pyridoxal phosphate-dependent enzyme [Christensenellaceae bacterium]
MSKYETYTYTKNQEFMARAGAVIPSGVYGHLGPAEGCMIPTSAFPFFATKAKGSEMWDADGNRFIDYMCGYGPNVVGYADDEVDAAAQKQAALGNCTTLPSTVMVDFAELLTKTVKKDWSFFCKNGGDVTQFSIMIARAHTRKRKIIFVNGFYHGVAPWTQRLDSPGVLKGEVEQALYVDFNNIPQLKATIEANKDDIACFISTPYLHGNFRDNVLPEQGYWQEVRKLCTEYGIILIVDDIRAGFRLSVHGSDNHYGFEADLITFCKAIANGYNISALCGKDFLKATVSSIVFTGSYWMSAVPFAAGIANINKMTKGGSDPEYATRFFREKGLKLTDGMKAIAKNYGVGLSVSGEPAMFYIMITDDKSLLLHQEWIAECVKRGVFITNHHNHFMNLSITDELIAETLDKCDDAMSVMVKNHPEVYKK